MSSGYNDSTPLPSSHLLVLAGSGKKFLTPVIKGNEVVQGNAPFAHGSSPAELGWSQMSVFILSKAVCSASHSARVLAGP